MKQALLKKLNIIHPILQAPMAGGIVSPEFVAQVCEFGFLGGIPSGYLSLSQTKEFIQKVKAKTDKPFSLNIFVDYTKYGNTSINKPVEIVALERSLNEESEDSFKIPAIPSIDNLIQLVIDSAIPVLSTTFGLLSPNHIEILKENNIKIMTTINSIYELELALKCQGSDILIYQNAQAGGHKGGFTSLPHSDEFSILKHLESYPYTECVLAGGIVTRKDIDNALNMGFCGVQIGTGFLATQESSASDTYKEAIVTHQETALTMSITGKAARGLKNTISRLEVKENLGFPFMHYATSGLRKTAKSIDNREYQSLWCGDGISKVNTLPTLHDYMSGLVA